MMKEAVMDIKESGTSIVFSSHQMDLVEELCENVCILREGNAVVQGNLTDIKRSYGKKNLIIHADEPLDFLQRLNGVVRFKQVSGGCELQIMNEEVSQRIFEELQGHGFVRKFELEELSLNDIFIEKVGESYE